LIITNTYRTLFFTLLCLFSSTNVYAELISGYEYLSEQAQEIQNDTFQNPGYLLIEKGIKAYNQAGENEQLCQHCHGSNGSQFKPKSIARFPKYHAQLDKPVTLRDQIQHCWSSRLDNFKMLYDDETLLALETMIRNKAKGEKVNIDISGKMRPYYERGKELYNTRFGQMEMNCKQCHDLYTGKMLRAQKLSCTKLK